MESLHTNWGRRRARHFFPSASGGESRIPRLQTALSRIVATSADTGARFVRERIDVVPMAWLASPKRLLGGRTPLDACRTHEGFRRVAVLHELSLGLDADPVSVSGIVLRTLDDRDGTFPGMAIFDQDRPDDNDLFRALYSATIVHEDERGCFHIFAAMIAHSASEVRRRLRLRLGRLLEGEATVRLGFDWSEPLACSLVSAAVADVLMLAAKDPSSSIAVGLDFQVEQRFTY